MNLQHILDRLFFVRHPLDRATIRRRYAAHDPLARQRRHGPVSTPDAGTEDIRPLPSRRPVGLQG